MTSTDANGRAAAVSAAIRKAGMRPLPSGTPRGRQGIRVTRSTFGFTSVEVVLDAPGERARMTADVTAALVAAGYTVTPGTVDEIASYMTVTK